VNEAVIEKGEDYMTNQQFDAVIKMVLHLIDANDSDPKMAREMILDLLIDEKTREKFEKPMVRRKKEYKDEG